MVRDSRGIERGKCRVDDCDCTEFVTSDEMSCGYCGDPPAKHENLSATSSNESPFRSSMYITHHNSH